MENSRQDIIELFQIMDGNPVTVRLLDPPLHEFIPHLGKTGITLPLSLRGLTHLEAKLCSEFL